MEPSFVAVLGTYDSELRHPYGIQCHEARIGGGEIIASVTARYSGLPATSRKNLNKQNQNAKQKQTKKKSWLLKTRPLIVMPNTLDKILD